MDIESSIVPHSDLQVQPQNVPDLDKKTEKGAHSHLLADPAQRAALEKFRKGLPIYKYRHEILNHVQNNAITVISGDTGSGKSTQIPQYLYESRLSHERVIGVTQPRRVAALTLASRVALEVKRDGFRKNSEVGDLVGYNIRFEEKFDRKTTKIKFMTDGMLIREMILDPNLSRYSFIVVDEAHERSVQTDILLTLARNIVQNRKDFKLIVMSATLETEKFLKFFDTTSHFKIEGRCFPIEIYNTVLPQADYIDGSLNTILQIHFTEPSGDILVFLTGQDEIEDLEQMLNERMESFPTTADKLVICPIYAALPSHIQMRAFEKTPPKHRKVVLATNIAETSVTIEGIKYVIDTGFVKIRKYIHSKSLETLVVIPISKSSALQRAGRAGRQSAGKCYRLYGEDAFDTLQLYMTPEILRVNLANVILQLKALNVPNIDEFDFVDPPKAEVIRDSIEMLKDIHALDENLNLTNHGKEMVELPLDPIFSHLLLVSLEDKFSCPEQILTIISILSVENFFYVPKDQKNNLSKVLLKFKYPNSDLLTKLHILNKLLLSKNRKDFTQENYVNKKSIKRALMVRQQLAGYLDDIKAKRANSKVTTSDSQNKAKKDYTSEHVYSYSPMADFDAEKVSRCLAVGLNTKLAKLNSQGSYTLKSGQTASIHPESVVFYNKSKPEYLIYNEVIITTKTYLRDVSEISATHSAKDLEELFKN